MTDLCETISAVLGLYAEGELHDPLAVEMVRGHLSDCVDCRETLDVYDDLTRTLLSGGGPLGAGGGWAELEGQRRVDGVLKRFDRQALTGEAAGNGSRVAAFRSADAFALIEQSNRPRLQLSVDDLVESHASTRRRKSGLGASGPRRSALAAVVLFGLVSVWLAAVLSGMLSEAPELDRQVLRGAPDSLSPVVASSHRFRDNREPLRRENDRSLRWVVSGAGVEPRLAYPRGSFPRRGGGVPSELELLFGSDDRYATRARSSKVILSSTPTEADIRWVAQVVLLESPPEYSEARSEPRYLLVRDSVTELPDPTRSGRPLDASGLWFQLGWIERRPARKSSAPLLVGNSNIYRVCVYEEIRRLELPLKSWAPARWPPPSTFRGEAFGRMAPRPLSTFTGNWLNPAAHPKQNRRY